MNDAALREPLAGLDGLWGTLDRAPGDLGPGLAYAQGMHRRPLRYYADRIRKLGLRGQRVLDAGCGTGTWSFALRSAFDEVIGIDSSEERVRVAQWIAREGRVGGVDFRVGTILDTRLPDGSVDAVFCYSVLISSLPPREALAEFRRVLKPGGIIYVSLNGIGWSYYLRDERKEDPKYAEMGRQGIYNTIVRGLPDHEYMALSHPHSSAWEKPIGPGRPDAGTRLRIQLDQFHSTVAGLMERVHARCIRLTSRIAGMKSVTAVLAEFWLEWWIRRLSPPGMHPCKLKEITRLIEAECGEPFMVRLAQDLIEIGRCGRSEFSHANAGRGYHPDEIEGLCRASGLIDFQWSCEGLLAGSVMSNPPAPIHEGYFHNHLKVWEFVCFKPDDSLGEHISPQWFRNNALQQAHAPFLAQARQPIITNVDAALCPRGWVQEARRRAEAAGGARFVQSLARKICAHATTDEDRLRLLTRFTQDAIIHHPFVQAFEFNGAAVTDPGTLLFLGIGRCGAAAPLVAALCAGVGIPSRVQHVPGHIYCIAQAGGEEFVLESDFFKKGVLPTEPDGRLLRHSTLLANPRIVDRLPDFYVWWIIHFRDAADLFGRRPFGYINTDDHLPIYSTYFESAAGPRFKPRVPVLTGERRGQSVRLSWSDATPRDGAPVEYRVAGRPSSRGWSYDAEPEDLRAVIDPPAPRIERLVQEPVIELTATEELFFEVTPRLKERPDVFCWPSNEVHVEAATR